MPEHPRSATRRRWFRSCLLAALAGVAGLVLIGFFLPHWLLTVESVPARADVIIVLGGEPRVRVARAVEAFKAGIAPRIIVSGHGDCSANIRELTDAGIPRSAIIAECASRSTLENARNCAPLLAELRARRVVVVTSWYHSRRALACFEDASPQVEMLSLPTTGREATPRQFVLNEYLKLGYYAVKHGIWPFPG